MYKKLLTISTALLLLGCQTEPTINPTSIATNNQVSSSQQTKVAKAFENSKALEASHSKWFDRQERLPLTIITTAYIDNEVIKTKEYKAYKILIKKIQKDITLLDKLSGKKMSSKYSSVSFVDYDKDSRAKAKFNAAYTNQHSDKDKLTDILRPDIEKPSQELLIRLNLNELKKGNLTIEGYKTVKESKKTRNSYYYTLRKTNYSKLNKKDKNQAIVDSLLATLQLSIPEYVSIDRKELVKKGEVLRFITPQSDGSYTGEVWKNEANDEVARRKAEILDIKNNSKRETLNIINNYEISKTLKTLKGHTGKVSSVAISPDGKYALSASKDDTLRYWNLTTGKTIKVFNGVRYSFNSVAISQDGKYAISGGWSGLKYLNLKTGEVIKVLKDGMYTESVAISPDGKHAISGGKGRGKSKDFDIRYWNLKTGKIIKLLKGHTEIVNSLAISSDGKYALSGGGDYKGKDFGIRYWNLKTGKTIKILKGHTERVSSVVISKDSKYALSGSVDDTLRYWNLKTGTVIKVLKAKIGTINSVAISHDGKYALSTQKRIINYWNLKTGRNLKKLKWSRGEVNSVTISPDGMYALLGGDDNTLRYGKIERTAAEKKEAKEKEAEEKKSEEIRIAKEKKIEEKIAKEKISKLNEEIENIEKLKKFRFYDGSQNILTISMKEQDINILKSAKYIKLSKELTSDNISVIANVLNYQYDDPILNLIFNKTYTQYANFNYEMIGKTMLLKKREKYDLNELYFSTYFNLKDAQYNKIKELKNIDIDFKEAKVLEGHPEEVDSVAISPDGKYALSGSNTPNVVYWNLKNRQRTKFLQGHTGGVSSVAISLDGKYALSGGSYDKILRYWYLETGRTLKVLKGHTGSVNSVAISKDGKYALSGANDEVLNYWSLKSGEIIKTLEGHTKPVLSVAISPNGNYALSASKDDTLRYWNLKTGKTIKVFKGEKYSFNSVAISQDGKYALSGGWKGLKYLNLKTGEVIKVLKEGKYGRNTNSVAISPDGKHAISGGKGIGKSKDFDIRYWNLKTGKIIKLLKGHTEEIRSVAISLDGKYALSGGGDYKGKDFDIRYWNLALIQMNEDY